MTYFRKASQTIAVVGPNTVPILVTETNAPDFLNIVRDTRQDKGAALIQLLILVHKQFGLTLPLQEETLYSLRYRKHWENLLEKFSDNVDLLASAIARAGEGVASRQARIEGEVLLANQLGLEPEVPEDYIPNYGFTHIFVERIVEELVQKRKEEYE